MATPNPLPRPPTPWTDLDTGQPTQAFLQYMSRLDALVQNSGGGGTGRTTLTAATTYYVRTDGSDSSSGLIDAPGGGFATLQHAIDVVSALDRGLFGVTIQVRAGTFAPGAGVLLRPGLGSLPITIVGDTTTPTNVVLNTGSGACFSGNQLGDTVYNILGMQLRSTNSCILATGATQIGFERLTFGVDGVTMSGAHMNAQNGGQIRNLNGAAGAYTVLGSAFAHIIAAFVSVVDVSGTTITWSPTNNTFQFTVFSADVSEINLQTCKLSVATGNPGANDANVHGIRFSSAGNAIVRVTGVPDPNFVPGDQSGQLSFGGQYI